VTSKRGVERGRRSIVSAAALVLVLGLGSCTGAPPAPIPEYAVPGACTDITRTFASLQAANPVEGYFEVRDLSEASLNRSSWMVQYLHATGLEMPESVQDDVRALFREVLRTAPADLPRGEGAPAALQYHLAWEALAALGEEEAPDGAFAALLAPGGFAASPGDEASVYGTYLAVRTLSAAGIRAPEDVIPLLSSAVPDLSDSPGIFDVGGDQLLALRALAEMWGAVETRAQYPDLQPLMTQWSREILEAGAGPVQLAALVDVVGIARAIDAEDALTDLSAFGDRALEAAGPLLSDELGLDPQFAVLLDQSGVAVSEDVRSAVRLAPGLGTHGWVSGVRAPDIVSNLNALTALQSCADHDGAEVARAALLADLGAVSTPDVATAYAAYRAGANDARLSALLDDVHIDSTDVVSLALRVAVEGPAAAANVAPSSAMHDTLDMVELAATEIVAEARGDARDREQALEVVRSLRTENGFRAGSNASDPDLYSTALAACVLGLSESERSRLLEGFRDERGTFALVAGGATNLAATSVAAALAAGGECSDLLAVFDR
jgi:hypothetical protein